MILNVDIPEILAPLYESKKRFIVIYGGRGSGKSWGVADFLLITAYTKSLRILCTREVQNSIRDSVHKLLSDRIRVLGLSAFYHVTDKTIKGKNGSEFIFKGLHRNIDDIKSTEGINLCWVEEGHKTSKRSFDTLIPTIREDDSQIIVTYNPDSDRAPIHADWTLAERDDCLKIRTNYFDNPFFPKVLESDMLYMKRVNYEQYLHVWEGECRTISDACIFKGKFREEYFEEPHESTIFYFGADWGFSVDPIAVVRFFIRDNIFYIDYEAGGINVEIPDTPALFDTIPEIRKYEICADSARPELNSYMRNQGFIIKKAKKAPGSIEEGIAFLRSFESIVVHPRCKRVLDEFKYYSYKVDKLTDEVTTQIVDKSNHFIDALRYGSEKMRLRMRELKKAAVDRSHILGW